MHKDVGQSSLPLRLEQFQRRAQKYRCSFANLSDNGEASEEEACRSCRHSPRFQATSGNQLCTMNTFERCLVKGDIARYDGVLCERKPLTK